MSAAVHKLVIIHTNDIHSRFEQMPKIATAVAQLKQVHGADQVVTIDCGDHLDRAMPETEGTGGLANVKIMNETGYDAFVFGNNEGLTFTMADLEATFAGHAAFPVICSNMLVASENRIPAWIAPYRIVEKGRLRIGLIGATINFTDFYKDLGWDVKDPLQTVAHWVDKLRPEVHIMIVISHLGLANDRKMAEEIEGIDCILGGHTHHLLEQPLKLNETYICGAGKFGEYVGVVELHYDLFSKRLVHGEGKCISVSELPDAKPIADLVSDYRRISEVNLSLPAARLGDPMPHDPRRESPLGNLLAAGIRSWTKAEIGIVNAGQIVGCLPSGVVTQGQLLSICPSPINPCLMRLDGESILHALEESLLEEFVDRHIRGFGFRGDRLGTLCLDGLTVEYNPDAGPFRKISRVLVNGVPLDRDSKYNVGTIDMFSFGIGYSSLAKGEVIRYFLPEFIRDVLKRELNNPEAVRISGSKRHWFVKKN